MEDEVCRLRFRFYLSPVGEDLSVAAVGDELLRKLSDGWVQVVEDHQHQRPGLGCLRRKVAYAVRPLKKGRVG